MISTQRSDIRTARTITPPVVMDWPEFMWGLKGECEVLAPSVVGLCDVVLLYISYLML